MPNPSRDAAARPRPEIEADVSNNALQSTTASSKEQDRPRKTSSVSVNNITVGKYLPRQLYKWESPLLIVGFFVLGLAFSITHCVFYATLGGTVVPDSARQENNLRYGPEGVGLSRQC